MDKQRLKQYRDLAAEAEELEEKIKELRGKAESRTWPDGMPHSNFAGDRTASIVANIADMCSLLDTKQAELLTRLTEIEEAIEALEPVERRLIRLRYISCWEWEDICEAIGYAERQMFRLHATALRKIEKTWQ